MIADNHFPLFLFFSYTEPQRMTRRATEIFCKSIMSMPFLFSLMQMDYYSSSIGIEWEKD